MCLEWKAALVLGKRSLMRLDTYVQTATEQTQLCRAKATNWLIMISE